MARQEARRVNPRNFACDQCDRAYTTNQKLKFHKMRAHETGGPKFPCPLCDKVMINPGTLQAHIRSQHSERPKVTYCEICGKQQMEQKVQNCCSSERQRATVEEIDTSTATTLEKSQVPVDANSKSFRN